MPQCHNLFVSLHCFYYCLKIVTLHHFYLKNPTTLINYQIYLRTPFVQIYDFIDVVLSVGQISHVDALAYLCSPRLQV